MNCLSGTKRPWEKLSEQLPPSEFRLQDGTVTLHPSMASLRVRGWGIKPEVSSSVLT